MPRSFDTPLPIDAVLDQLAGTLARTNAAVLVAPPGAGKTTRVPLALLDASWLGTKKIIMLEPRRIAARASAERMAKTLGERAGETVFGGSQTAHGGGIARVGGGGLRGGPGEMCNIRLDSSGLPPFNSRVYDAVRKIPRGETRTVPAYFVVPDPPTVEYKPKPGAWMHEGRTLLDQPLQGRPVRSWLEFTLDNCQGAADE